MVKAQGLYSLMMMAFYLPVCCYSFLFFNSPQHHHHHHPAKSCPQWLTRSQSRLGYRCNKGDTLIKDRTSLSTLQSGKPGVVSKSRRCNYSNIVEGGNQPVTLPLYFSIIIGAFNRSISVNTLERAMDFSLLTLHRGGGVEGKEGDDEISSGDPEHLKDNGPTTAVDVLSPMSGPSPFHPVFGRWELTFVSLKRFPFPFYLPLENIIKFERDGPGKIKCQATLFGLDFPLGAFKVSENSTRSEKAPQVRSEKKVSTSSKKQTPFTHFIYHLLLSLLSIHSYHRVKERVSCMACN